MRAANRPSRGRGAGSFWPHAFARLAHALDRRRAQVTGQRPGYGVRSIDTRSDGAHESRSCRIFAHGDGFGKQRILLRAAFAGAAQQQRRDKKQKAIREHVEKPIARPTARPGDCGRPGMRRPLRHGSVRQASARRAAGGKHQIGVRSFCFMQFCPKLPNKYAKTRLREVKKTENFHF